MSNNEDFKQLVKSYMSGFYPVVPFQPERDKLIPLDFTESNTGLLLVNLKDTDHFTEYITQLLEQSGAAYGIGGYLEHRTIYSRSAVFDPPAGTEPRRLHLGVDIWGAAGTPVYAPMEGTVHSVGFNEAFGDYGATLILQHEIEDTLFHTLYGHLSLSSIQHVKEGQDVEKGQWIAAFGVPAENGHWPPHLHFQIVLNMEGHVGDYPGVCAYSQKEKYQRNCPDPDLILNLKQYTTEQS